jgi:DNA-binding NtrC family response regulator
MAGRVLIIESDQTFRESLAQWMSGNGFKVYEGADAQEGEQIARETDVDVAIIGLIDLGREGLGALKIIKEHSPLTEIILIAGSAQLPLAIEGMKLGAFDDLRPPIDMSKLLSRVRDAFRKKKRSMRAGKSVRRRLHELLVATTFAEAGEFDMAREVLGSKGVRTRSGKPDRDKHNTGDSAVANKEDLS